MSIGLTVSQFEDVADIHAIEIEGEVVWVRNNPKYESCDEIPEKYMQKEICRVIPIVEVTSNYKEEKSRSTIVRAKLKILLWN